MNFQLNNSRTYQPDINTCRCPNCNRLLFKGRVKHIEIQCPKCGFVQTIRCKDNPLRLIALNASNVDLYYAAGGQLVGRPDTTALPPELLSKIQKVPAIGETLSPDINRIIALKPDLVLAADMHLRQSFLALLEQAGIPIYLQRLDNYRQISHALRFYGELADNPRRASLVIEDLDSKLLLAQEQAKRKSRLVPRVLIIWASAKSFYTALPGSFIGDLICRLKAVNVAANSSNSRLQYVPFDLALAIEAKPDIILLITHSYEHETNDKIHNELALHPQWQKLSAVRANRVYQLPHTLFAVNPGSRVDEAMDYLSLLLYS